MPTSKKKTIAEIRAKYAPARLLNIPNNIIDGLSIRSSRSGKLLIPTSRRDESMSSILVLPTELIVMIFKHLPKLLRCNLALTSKFFACVAEAANLLVQKRSEFVKMIRIEKVIGRFLLIADPRDQRVHHDPLPLCLFLTCIKVYNWDHMVFYDLVKEEVEKQGGRYTKSIHTAISNWYF